MFSTTAVILRLREQAPFFQQRVGGTLSFSRATAETDGVGEDLPTPHCFVVPLTDKAEMPEGSMVAQRVTEHFATIVCVSNEVDSKDGPGINADTRIRQARFDILKSILHWQVAPGIAPIRYVRGFHLHMNKSRVWHQFEWQVSYYICRTKEVADAMEAEMDAIFDDPIPYRNVEDLIARISIDGEFAGLETILEDGNCI